MKRGGSPWTWIPTLYAAEGVPYVAVNVLTVLLYTQLGIPKAQMAFFTGWLYLPWVIKPFWAPFVDVISTKRRWTLAMQFIMGTGFASVAFLLPLSFFFSTTLAVFWLIAFCSATHDIAADGFYMLALDPRQQAAFVGIRSTFYRIASLLTQGALVIFTGWLARKVCNDTEAWSATFLLLGLLFILFGLWHSKALPTPPGDVPVKQTNGNGAAEILRGFAESFATFFRKPGIVGALLFMLLFRLPEALCIKMVAPFLMEERSAGGLGLSIGQIGFANGTIGVVALLAGGIVGGIAIARGGLRRWLYPMAAALTLPCVLYCWLAAAQPEDFTMVCAAIGVEQFGYGFGFTAFMMYLIYFSQGKMQTSHYAFCTAFMALGMMLPGMAAGWLCDIIEPLRWFGTPKATSTPQFLNFFWAVMAACLFTFLGCYAGRHSVSPANSIR